MKSWCAIGLLCVLAAGCGEDAPAGECPLIESNRDCQPVKADTVRHYITPTEIFTGANGRDLYQAGLEANFGDLAVSSATPSVVCVGLFGCVGPNEDGIVALVTALSPGQTYLTATSGSITAYITVHVADYMPAQYDLGSERYNNPANPNATDRIACVSCHSGQGGAPHTPLALGGKSDAVLLSSIQQSKYPDTCENDSGSCDCAPANGSCSACSEGDCRVNEGYTLSLEAFGGGVGDHVFDLTDDEANAMMAYIRAIPLDY